MNRKRHIDTRNLVVTETFNEFAEKVNQTDFTVEDIVGYVTSVARIFYWLNVESIWGVLGFTWDTTSLTDLEDAYNPWERLEHVIAAGKNIDGEHGELTPEEQAEMDAAMARRLTPIKKGYGYFNATTIPFTIIPKLPDGERITAFRSSFDNIDHDIELIHSNWVNLKDLYRLATGNKTVKMDLSDAPIETASQLIYGNGKDKTFLYLKADLLNISYINSSEGTAPNGALLSQGTLLWDDDNKNINLPLDGIYNWSKFKYIGNDILRLEDIFRNVSIEYTNRSRESRDDNYIEADSRKMYLTNIDWLNNNKALGSLSGNALRMNLHIERQFETESTSANYPDETSYDITIDTRVRKNIRLRNVFACWNTQGGHYWKLNPIQYVGEIDSIDYYNPYCTIEDNWPAMNQSIIDKFEYPEVQDADNFMPFLTLINNIKCPYTINCINVKILRLFSNIRRFSSDYSALESIIDGKTYYEFYPTLINSNMNLQILTFNNPFSNPAKILLPTVTAKSISIDSGGHIFKSGRYFTCNSFVQNRSGLSDIENTEIPVIHVVSQGYDSIHVRYIHTDNGAAYEENINVIQYDSNIVNNGVFNETLLKNSVVTFRGLVPTNGYTQMCPLIRTNAVGSAGNGNQRLDITRNFILPLDVPVFIYRTNTFITAMSMPLATVKKIIDSIRGDEDNPDPNVTITVNRTIWVNLETAYPGYTAAKEEFIVNNVGIFQRTDTEN